MSKIDAAKSFSLIGARCLVKQVKLSNETESGIILQNRDKEQTNHGIVLKVGEGAMLEDGTIVPMQVKAGDHVLFTSFSGIPVKVNKDDDEEYLILNERDIICIYLPEVEDNAD